MTAVGSTRCECELLQFVLHAMCVNDCSWQFFHLLDNEIFATCYLYKICNSNTIKICANQHAGLLRFLSTDSCH